MAEPNTARVSRDSLRISSVEPTGWEPSSGRIPTVGETVYCTDGPAEVVRVLGKTSDGSRLLELRFGDRGQPFFAASSNVLVQSAAAEGAVSDGASPFLDAAKAVGGTEG
jgi:hypothetical protein